MARETRIGLLVGLFFIVMFGLVLTELTGGGKTAPAPADSVNEAVKIAALPASEDTSPAVLAGGEVVARAGPPPWQGVTPPIAPAAVASGTAASVQVPAAGSVQDLASPPAREPALLSAVESLPAPADSEELTASLKTVIARDAASPAWAGAIAAAPAAAEKVYTVQPKDTLRKIARTIYGPQNEKEYRRIFEANKRTLKSESILSVGQVLAIPPLPGQAPPARAAGGQADEGGVRQMDVEELQKHLASVDGPQAKATGAISGAGQTSGRAAGKAARVYVVAPGDNLAKISRKTLGNDKKATIARLHNANKGKLTSPQRLAIGMKLEIPG
jgi:nucleoid-associated protein YgaU